MLWPFAGYRVWYVQPGTHTHTHIHRLFYFIHAVHHYCNGLSDDDDDGDAIERRAGKAKGHLPAVGPDLPVRVNQSGTNAKMMSRRGPREGRPRYAVCNWSFSIPVPARFAQSPEGRALPMIGRARYANAGATV